MSQVTLRGVYARPLDPRAAAAHQTFAGILPRQSRLYAALRWMYQPIKAVRLNAAQAVWNIHSGKIIERYLSTPGFKGLHVGCGRFRLDGWLNTDQLGARGCAPAVDFPLDITRPFPFPDGSFDAIYACEVIEHITQPEGEGFLREALRVLRPERRERGGDHGADNDAVSARGGVLRITTPGLEACCRLYLGLNPDATIEQFGSIFLEGDFCPDAWLNTQFSGHGHKHLWSQESLTRTMKRIGFHRAIACRPQETTSDRAELKGLEMRYGANPAPWLFARTLIVEGVKGT
jgi:SAM-dependent methyltransferase